MEGKRLSVREHGNAKSYVTYHLALLGVTFFIIRENNRLEGKTVELVILLCYIP